MKGPALALALIAAPAIAHAGDLFGAPGVMVGLAFKLVSQPSAKDLGITAKILSNRHEDSFVLGAGLTVYPMDKNVLGLDLAAGYNFDHATAMAGFDVLHMKPQISVGWSPTKGEPPAQVPAPPPAPAISSGPIP